MTEHRRSYWGTAVSAAFYGLAEFAGTVWLTVQKLTAHRPWPPLKFVVWCACILMLLCAQGATNLVLAGALVSLRRDRLESLGVPYAGRSREWHGGIVVRGCRSILRGVRNLRGRRPGRLDLRTGELVEIRSREEILATLDSRGEQDSLPFMPEMEPWCGSQARVFRRVDKIFDWITGSGMRRMRDTVMLEGLRCNGCHHGNCQADCPILWKESWLRRASIRRTAIVTEITSSSARLDLREFTKRIDAETSEPRYVCQLTNLPQATTPTPWNDPRNFLRELLSGNVRIGPLFALIGILAFNSVQRRLGRARFPHLVHANLQTTPHAELNLQPGELVRIKSKREIELTLNAQFKNRGLWFDKEMIRFCGGTYRVLARVNRQIDERTGKMMSFSNPCIILEDVTATGEYHELAPLDERIYWREIWLERLAKEHTTDFHAEDKIVC